MAWTAPMTWSSGSVLTAAQLNTYARDNMNETAPAKITTAGQYVVGTAANTIAARAISTALVATSQGTTTTSYVDLATVGPSVTVTTGTQALVIVSALMSNNSAGNKCFMDFAVSSASTRAATDSTALRNHSGVANEELHASRLTYVTGLTAGSNVFTAKYKSNGSTATFENREITVIPY